MNEWKKIKRRKWKWARTRSNKMRRRKGEIKVIRTEGAPRGL
jgi:hypothetical protein